MERRHQILEAAGRLLLQYGPGKVTVADIARDAGVGVGSVYLEYRSKDEILIALSSRRFQRVLDAMQRAARESRGAERLRAVLRARLRAFLELAEDGDHGPELLHCYCPAVEEAWRRFTAAEEAIVAEVLGQGVAEGELQGEPTQLAPTVLAACATFSPPLLCKRRPADAQGPGEPTAAKPGETNFAGTRRAEGGEAGRDNLAERAERLFGLLLDGLRHR